jgi:hypothetical protein
MRRTARRADFAHSTGNTDIAAAAQALAADTAIGKQELFGLDEQQVSLLFEDTVRAWRAFLAEFSGETLAESTPREPLAESR